MISLNLYVGPLCRYYTGKWETIAQRYAREHNLTTISVVAQDAVALTRLKPRVVRSRIIAWRSNLNAQYADVLSEPLDWDERANGGYFTDKPDIHGYGGLNLWAAYLEKSYMNKPEDMPEEWREDPAYIACRAPGFNTSFKNILHESVFWLPVDFGMIFRAKDPRGRIIKYGSSLALLNELNALNAASWMADQAMIDKWSMEGAPVDASLEKCAQFAFAVFRRMATASVENKLPMLLHLV